MEESRLRVMINDRSVSYRRALSLLLFLSLSFALSDIPYAPEAIVLSMMNTRVKNINCQQRGHTVNAAEQTKLCPYKRPARGKERKGDGENIAIAGTEDQYVTNTITTIRACMRDCTRTEHHALRSFLLDYSFIRRSYTTWQ